MSNKQTDEQGKPLTYWGGLNNDHIVDANKKVSSIEWLKNEIDNELKVIDNLYGKEIMGRKIGLAFVKRIIEQAKEMHKKEIVDAYRFGLSDEYVIGSQKYYNETFGK